MTLDELRAARRRSGMSQASIAKRIGTTQSAVARIEAAGADPRLSTIDRYVKALGARLVLAERTPTLAATAEAIAAAIDVPQDAFRLGIQFIDDVTDLGPAERWAAIRDEPESTGSRRWDALLAGLAEHIAMESGVRVPGWATAPSRFLPDFWFVVEDLIGRPSSALSAIAFATAPPAFASRGVFLDRSSLASV